MISIFLFNKAFNRACHIEKNDSNDADIYQITNNYLFRYNLKI